MQDDKQEGEINKNHPQIIKRVYAEWEDVRLLNGAKSEKRNPKLDLKQ